MCAVEVLRSSVAMATCEYLMLYVGLIFQEEKTNLIVASVLAGDGQSSFGDGASESHAG